MSFNFPQRNYVPPSFYRSMRRHHNHSFTPSSRTRLIVTLEELMPPTVSVRIANSAEAENQLLPRIDFYRDFYARRHSMKEHRVRQNARVGILSDVFHIFREHARVKQVGDHLLI